MVCYQALVKVTQGRLNALDNSNILTPAIQAGVDRFREIFSECSLLEVKTTKDEIISFELKLPVDYLGVERDLRIGFTKSFPSTALNLSIKPSPWLEWPHILDDFVCLFGSGNKAVYGDPVEVVNSTFFRLGKLISLVCDNMSINIIKAEFDNEVISYWSMQAKISNHKLIILNKPAKSTPLYTLSSNNTTGKDVIWVSDDESKILEHYQWQVSPSKKKIDAATATFYIKLTSTPDVKLPDAFGLINWLSGHTEISDIERLKTWIEIESNYPLRWIIIEIHDSSPVSTIAFLVTRKGVKDNQNFNFGLRKAKKKALKNPISERDKLFITETFMIDNEVIFSRLKDYEIDEKTQRKVLLIGAGSLGSHVASQLVHSGITDLTIIDPDYLDDSNLGRHILTINDLGKSKALSLKEYLMSCIPTAKLTAIAKTLYQAHYDHDIDIYHYDCIISTAADWSTEYYLWEMKSKIKDIAFIQAWAEPHAFVGHVICSDNKNTADARHLFDKSGNFKNKFTYWKDNGFHKLPACGAGFIPGSALNIQQIASMVSKSVINIFEKKGNSNHKVWNSYVTDIKKITVAGGQYVGPCINDNIESMVINNEWFEE